MSSKTRELYFISVVVICDAGGLRLADEAFLTEKLGVTQGAVTALSLHNDKDKSVRCVAICLILCLFGSSS